ncbi:MAG: glycosyltransferase family 4 protein [Phycisphaerales bacterium]|nr:glycosyltransferase family 4 protein [Phycisphaerales bacterium]
MLILHLSTRLILGGSQENTVLSCEGQARAGHEVHLAFGPIYGPEGSLLERVQAFRTADARGITTHTVPHLVRELSPWRDRMAYSECRRLIAKIDPDIVHTHSSKAGILGRLAGWKEGGAAGRRGIIHTIHGLPFHPYESRWRNWVYIQAERIAARRCHAIVTVCDAMKTQALAAKIGRDDLYTTAYSGMETEQFLDPGVTREQVREQLGLSPEDFVIGTVARLAELKGHDDLLDAIGEIMRVSPNWKMLWVGDGWWRDRLMSRVRELGLEKQVILTGLVPPEQVPAMMRAMDVLVHPSYREGLPRTVPQALLSGVPVVAYSVDGAPEVCIDGQTGRLVAPGQRRALSEAIAWMADHPAERAAMAERGRELCRERFSVQRMVDDLQVVYERVLQRLTGRSSGST